MAIPKKVQQRLLAGLKHYQPIVGGLRKRDISEADTVTVVKDMMADMFGYDKYTELTSEQQIRGTFCDLAVKVDGKIHYLAEVKAAGLDLNENHLRQAVNYGAHQGIEWIILTNALEWRIYRLKFGQPIDYSEVCRICICDLSGRSGDHLNLMFMLCREAISSDALAEYHRQAQILNRFVIAELLQSDDVVVPLRRTVRRLFDNIRVSEDDLRQIMADGVFKRDVIDGDEAKSAKAVVKKATASLARKAPKPAVAAEG